MSNVVRMELPADATRTGNPEGSQSAQAPERPQWLPEKFKSPEDLAKAYGELEKKFSSGPKPESKPAQPPKETKPAEGEQEKPAPKEGESKDGEAETPETPKAPEGMESFQPFFDEFAKEGKLTDESYKVLAEKHNLPKEIVDRFIADSVKANTLAAQQAEAEVFSAVGGQDNYKAMADWARENLSEAERNAYNKAIDSGDLAAIKLAVSGVYQKFSAVEGRPGARVRGSGSSSNVTPFQNTREVTEAMSDPRYATDANYRKEVEQRLALSQVF